MFATFCLVCAAFVPQSAIAQGVIAGTISAAGTQEPLQAAQIHVAGTSIRTVSDERGQFRIANVSGTSATLEVRRIGYRLARVQARVGDENLRVVLALNPTSLEAVVVTGTAGIVQKRELGNSVGLIDASSVVDNAPIVSMQSLINGRSPGVVVMPTSGMVGSGQQLRIRGTASFALGNNPLIYIDGVRVNNDVATGPISQAFGSRAISRLNDLNPSDIESIEILKGPSAATLYGTEASNGVVNIITKRGATSAPKWNATLKQGMNYLKDWETRFPTNYGVNPSNGQIEAISLDSLRAGNQGKDYFRTGRHQETDVALSGGSDKTTYYLSGSLLDSEGAESNNNVRRYNTRGNLSLEVSPTFQIGTSLGFARGPTYLACEGGCGGHVWTRLLATPANYNNPRRHGFHSLLPYQYDQIYTYWQDLDRSSASVRLDHTPASWFNHRLNLGIDRTREGDNRHYRRVDSLVYTVGSEALGLREVNERTTSYRSLDYSGSATYALNPAVQLTSSVGSQFYHNSTGFVYAFGTVFPTPGLSTVQATTTNKVNDQDYFEDKTLGFYGQQQVAWNNRLFATAAIRSDDNSAFGQEFNRVVYPKFSLSWVISEEPWFGVPVVGRHLSSLRLRSAYGEAGKAPATYASLRTFASATGPADAPAVTPQFIGNPNLGPERGKEYELGFDASAIDDRLGLEVTYYNKKTIDAILDRQIAPSVGFSGTQPFNAGAIRNTGTELTLRGTPYRSSMVDLDIAFNYATNENKVLDLANSSTADALGNQFVGSGSFTRHVVGYPAFGFWEKRVTSASFAANGRTVDVAQLYCDDGRGGQVLCAGANGVYGGAVLDDAPLVYLGRSVPPREGSITTTLTLFERWRLYSFVDFKHGHKKIDGNTRVRCTPVIGNRCRENHFPEEFDPKVLAGYQNSNIVDGIITDASFTKWREVSLSYDVPDRFARRGNVSSARVSVAGRNLKTWTKFKGFEPEAMWLGGTRGGNVAWEQTMMPQLTSWIVSLHLGF